MVKLILTQEMDIKLQHQAGFYKPVNSSSTIKTTKPIDTQPSVKSISPTAPTLNSHYVSKPKTFEEVDFSGVKEGARVKHKAFGEGVITSINDNKVIVRFDKGDIEKKFDMAVSFANGFLKMI